MTPLKTGALAVTLILVIPIMLGFAMATEDVEETVAVTDNGGSLSEVVLNSTVPYYMSYSGANNNGDLYRVITSGDNAGGSLIHPDYVSTSDTTYTYTPVYETQYNTLTFTEYSAVTITTSDYTDGVQFIGDDWDDSVVPEFYTATLTIGSGSAINPITVHDSEAGYVVLYVPSTETVSLVKTGDYYRIIFTDASDTEIDRYIDELYISYGTVTMSYNTYQALSLADMPDYWGLSIVGLYSVAITSTSGTDYYGGFDNVTLIYSSGTVSLDSYAISGVTAISVAPPPGVNTLTYYNSGTVIETYADISYGWKIPQDSDSYFDYWSNEFSNHAVRIMAHVPDSQTLAISDSYGNGQIIITSSDGIIYVSTDADEWSVLGDYNYLMIEIEREDLSRNSSVTVSGISAWPSLGEMPTVLNSVTIDTSSIFYADITTLYFTDNNTATVTLRVDATMILAGYYPSTNNYNLQPYSLFPNDDWQSVVIDSVGIYGDSIGVNGTYYTISDSKTISITDLDSSQTVDVNVLGITIGAIRDDSTYTAYIDGYKVYEGTTPLSIQFIGDWSLTLHRTVTTESTITTTQWQAGEFAFTQDDFILCMILSTVLVFVGLGLMRGVKIGVLAVVCSAAGIIAFMIA